MNTKSLICPIGGEKAHIIRAVNETERFAEEEGLTGKPAMHLRLLAEEVLSMADSMLTIRNGSFWIEGDGSCYTLHLSAEAPVGENVRTALLGVSTDGKNAAYTGVKGKLRKAIDVLCGGDGPAVPLSLGDCAGTVGSEYDASYMEWDIQSWCEHSRRDEDSSGWNEIAMSILGRLSGHITVSVRPMQADIIVTTRKA